MSKVNTKVMQQISDLPGFYHEKRKMKRRLRRSETGHTKKIRMQEAKSLKGYCTYPYYIKEERSDNTYEDIFVPEQTVELTHFEHSKVAVTGEDGNVITDKKGNTIFRHLYQRVVDGYRVVPAHTKKRLVKRDYQKVDPYLKRISKSSNYKQSLKKTANRKIRNASFDMDFKRSGYKRLYDLAWELW